MPLLPSSADVPTVSPGVSRDPGLNAPAAAFSSVGSEVGVLAPAINEVSVRLQNQELKQNNRIDTIDRSKKINQYNLEVDDEIRRVSAEEDLSDPEVLNKLGGFMNIRKLELATAHGGSEDSMAQLMVRLQGIEGTAIGKASGISATIGRQAVQDALEDSLAPLGASTAQDPSAANINTNFQALDSQMDDLKMAFTPQEEEEARTAGRAHIANSALDTLISNGKVEQAEALLDDKGVVGSLDLASQRAVRKRINTVRNSKNSLMNEVKEMETQLGRKLTRPELLKHMGISPTVNKAKARDEKIAGLRARGISDDLSVDITDGHVKVVGPDPEGNFFTVNTTTGIKSPVSEEDKALIVPVVEAPKKEKKETSAPTTTKLAASVEEGTGPFSAMRAVISNTIGPLKAGTINEVTMTSKQHIRTFAQTAKIALVNNPRFPVAEQKIIANLLPDADKFFQDKDIAIANLKELSSALESMQSAKSKELSSKITTKRRGELIDQMSKLNEVLSMMEEPEEGGDQPDDKGFIVGKQYQDASGNSATYKGNGVFE